MQKYLLVEMSQINTFVSLKWQKTRFCIQLDTLSMKGLKCKKLIFQSFIIKVDMPPSHDLLPTLLSLTIRHNWLINDAEDDNNIVMMSDGLSQSW